MEVSVEKMWTLTLSDHEITNLRIVLKTVQRQLRITEKDIEFSGKLFDMIVEKEED